MTSLRFIVAAFGSAVVISLVSLLWPRFTDRPSPPVLTKVRQTVQQTSLGQQASDVLGIENDGTAEPLNVEEWVAAQGNAILSNISDSAQQVVVNQVVRQIMTQVDRLTPEQKTELQHSICVPSTPQPAPAE